MNPTNLRAFEKFTKDFTKKMEINTPFQKTICLEVLKTKGEYIKLIEDPDDELCFTAIKQNPFAVMYIESPSKEMLDLSKELGGFKDVRKVY